MTVFELAKFGNCAAAKPSPDIVQAVLQAIALWIPTMPPPYSELTPPGIPI